MPLKVEAYVLFGDHRWDTLQLEKLFDEEADDCSLHQEVLAEVLRLRPNADIVDANVYHFEEVGPDEDEDEDDEEELD